MYVHFFVRRSSSLKLLQSFHRCLCQLKRWLRLRTNRALQASARNIYLRPITFFRKFLVSCLQVIPELWQGKYRVGETPMSLNTHNSKRRWLPVASIGCQGAFMVATYRGRVSIANR